MNILIVTEHFLPKVDGVVTRICHTIEHLVLSGHSVGIITGKTDLKEYKGAKVFSIPSVRWLFYKEKHIILSTKPLKKIFHEFNPDLVHAINPIFAGAYAVKLAKKLNIKTVASLHTNYPSYLSHYHLSFLKPLVWRHFRKVFAKADLTLCTSAMMKNEMSAHGIKSVNVWVRGVDIEKFNPNLFSIDMRDKLSGHQPKRKVLLYAGRLAAEKNIYSILPLAKQHPEIHIAFAGNGPEDKKCKRLFPNATFLGFLKPNELAKAYASADALLFPSITETLGLSALEAMATGCPVIAANAGGLPEIVIDKSTGCLFDPNDKNGLTNAVELLYSNMENLLKMKEQAAVEARRWSWENATNQLVTLYEKIG